MGLIVQDGVEILRRAFASTLANWPLLLIRFLEVVVMIVVMVGGFLLALIPAGLAFDFSSLTKYAENPDAAAEWFLGNIGVLIYLVVAVSVLLGVAMLIHSFFEAGVTGAFIRYERNAAKWEWRDAMSRFSVEGFFEDAGRRGWRVFLIYNIVWGVAGLFILVPIAIILAVTLLLRESPAAIALACCGIVLILLFAIIVAIVAGAWAQLAITIGIAGPHGAMESSSLAGDMIKAKLWKVVLVMVVMMALSIGLSMITSTMNLAFTAGAYVPGGDWMMLPVQILGALLDSIGSSIVGLWLASSFVLIVLEPRKPVAGGQGAV